MSWLTDVAAAVIVFGPVVLCAVGFIVVGLLTVLVDVQAPGVIGESASACN